MPNRGNHRLNIAIEDFIRMYDGTAIGQEVRNMYENGTDYQHICDYIGIDYAEYEE